MPQFAYTTEKNWTDFAFIVDAMDLMYAGNAEAAMSCSLLDR